MLRAAFVEAVEKERRDVRVAGLALTVLALIGTVLLAAALASESARGGRAFPLLAGVFVAGVYAAFVLSNDTERRDRPWVLAAGLVLLPLTALTPTRLPKAAPSLFWILFAAGTLGGFGALGMAYRWRDPYLGWSYGPHRYDDPTTLRDDRDRAHLGLTWLVALPRLIVGGFADLLGHGWTREKLDASDVDAAVQILSRLAGHDRTHVDRLMRPRIRLWLTKMGLIRRAESGWALSRAGEKLVEQV